MFKKILKLRKRLSFSKFKYFSLIKQNNRKVDSISSLIHSLNFYSFRKINKNLNIDRTFYLVRRLLFATKNELKNRSWLRKLNIYYNNYRILKSQLNSLKLKYNSFNFKNIFKIKRKRKLYKVKKFFALYRRFLILMQHKKKIIEIKKFYKYNFYNYNYKNYIYNELNKKYYNLYDQNYNKFYNFNKFDHHYYSHRDQAHLFRNLLKRYNKNFISYTSDYFLNDFRDVCFRNKRS